MKTNHCILELEKSLFFLKLGSTLNKLFPKHISIINIIEIYFAITYVYFYNIMERIYRSKSEIYHKQHYDTSLCFVSVFLYLLILY